MSITIGIRWAVALRAVVASCGLIVGLSSAARIAGADSPPDSAIPVPTTCAGGQICAPNLRVRSVAPSTSHSGSTSLAITLENTGPVDTGAFGLAVHGVPARLNSGGVLMTIPISGVKAGGTFVVLYQPVNCQTHTTWAIVDPANVIAETHEDDNLALAAYTFDANCS